VRSPHGSLFVLFGSFIISIRGREGYDMTHYHFFFFLFFFFFRFVHLVGLSYQYKYICTHTTYLYVDSGLVQIGLLSDICGCAKRPDLNPSLSPHLVAWFVPYDIVPGRGKQNHGFRMSLYFADSGQVQ
jgi:hypothetical protein